MSGNANNKAQAVFLSVQRKAHSEHSSPPLPSSPVTGNALKLTTRKVAYLNSRREEFTGLTSILFGYFDLGSIVWLPFVPVICANFLKAPNDPPLSDPPDFLYTAHAYVSDGVSRIPSWAG